ncbi:MAG: hypothetical protein H7A49_12170 [Akkermansiaceae bacterium]|nr:hypothetical protein [Akkermansiaceae bacterium]
MFKKVVGRMETRMVQRAFDSGNMHCPECGSEPGGTKPEPHEVLRCPECGHEDVAREWVFSQSGPPRGWADRPPADNRIRREDKPDGSIVWYLPAGGNFGGFLLFGLLWTAITAAVSSGFLFTLLLGDSGGGSKSPPWFLYPILFLFFGVFWVIGIGMLFFAVRSKWEQARLRVTGDELILSRRLFGWMRHTRIRRDGVRQVVAEEFYSSNDNPVYGIRIGKGGEKLKFGTMLRAEEKGWLTADLRRVLLGEQPARRAAVADERDEEEARIPSKRAFSVTLPTARKHLWPLAVILTIMGVAFVCIGIFVIDGGDFPAPDKNAPVFVRIFDFVFDLLSQGFRGIWILFSTVMAAGGLWLTTHLLRTRRIERKLEGDSTTVALRKYRRGLVLSEQTWPRGDVKALRSSGSGHSNGKPMKRITLLAGNKEVTLASWVEGDAADAVVNEAKAALWD